jgi:hypothetical protein
LHASRHGAGDGVPTREFRCGLPVDVEELEDVSRRQSAAFIGRGTPSGDARNPNRRKRISNVRKIT